MTGAPVVTLDPRLLAPVASRVPAEAAVADVAGAPFVALAHGDWSAIAELPPAELAVVEEFLRELVALTVALEPAPPLPFDLRAPCRADAERWIEGFRRAPQASLAAALLLRRPAPDTWTGLVAESTTYSMLQSGPEFARWREHRSPPTSDRDDDGAARVRVERRPRVAEVVLTRPQRHNALDSRMRDELHVALDELASEPDTAIVVLGEGPSFCSGGDVDEFGTFVDPSSAHAVRLGRSLALRFARFGHRMVVGLHGACLGAGIELPAFAGHVIAADDATIGLPETGMGLLPGAGGTVSMTRRAGPACVLSLLLTGDRVDASTARGWGLVDEVVPRAELEPRARAVAAARSDT